MECLFVIGWIDIYPSSPSPMSGCNVSEVTGNIEDILKRWCHLSSKTAISHHQYFCGHLHLGPLQPLNKITTSWLWRQSQNHLIKKKTPKKPQCSKMQSPSKCRCTSLPMSTSIWKCSNDFPNIWGFMDIKPIPRKKEKTSFASIKSPNIWTIVMIF